MKNTTRRISMITATAIASSVLVIPAVAATDDAVVANGVIDAGTFAWGLDASFTGHLPSEMAGGQVAGTGGATFADGDFLFPVNAEGATTDAAGNAVIALDGGIDLKAYEGQGPDGSWGLDLQYDDPVLEITGTSATLRGDCDLSGPRAGGTQPPEGETGDGIPLITFTLAEVIDPADGAFHAAEVSTLAAQGVADSLGRYAVGTEMAPASLDLDFVGAAGTPPTPADGRSSVGFGLVAVLTAPGEVIALITGAPGAIPGPQLLT